MANYQLKTLKNTPKKDIPEYLLDTVDRILTEKVERPKPRKWGDLVNGEKVYPLHPMQREIFFSNSRFTAAIAGTGGGKTVLGPLWISRQIDKIRQTDPGRLITGMVVAPTYKILMRATVPTMLDTFQGTSLEGVYKETKNIFECKKQNIKIWCQGADNPGGLEGGQFDFVWGDEAGQFKLAVWTAVQGRTGQKQAPILLTTTPYGKNWLFHEFFKRYNDGDKDYFVRQWASKDNPAYPEEEYLRAKGGMTRERAAMRYDGQFMAIEGLVYPDFYLTKVEMEVDDILDLDGKYVGGLDYGWNDPFCALCGKLDSDGVLWIWYERYKSQTPIETHAEKLPKFKDRSIIWYSDHLPEYIRKLQKGGHRVRKAYKQILPGIDAVNERILTGKLKILYNRCPAVFAEAEMYAYPTDSDTEDTYGEKPEGSDHAMDALRYMIAGIDLKKAA